MIPLLSSFFSPALLSPRRLCMNFKRLGLRGLAGSCCCGEDSSGFTQGCESPWGDRRMSESVSLCLSSKPCQRRLCQRFHHGSVAPSFLHAYDLRHPDSARSLISAPPQPLFFSAETLHETTNTRSRCLSCFTVWVWAWMCRCCDVPGAGARKPVVSPCLCVCVWARVGLFWVTVWVRCSQAAALCKSAPSFSSHKSLLATNCHNWQRSQKKEREGRQGVRGLKKKV